MTAFAQATFVIKAPSSVALGEQFRVQYVLSNAEGDGFSNPSFADFDILSGPSQSHYSSFQIVNGNRSSSSSVTYTYILQARKKGTFQLPAATIHAGGKVLRTQTTSVSVSGQAAASGSAGSRRGSAYSDDDDYPQMQRAGAAISNSDLYFTVDATKRTVYEQEPIMLTYKFHSKVGVGLANVMLQQKPDLKGFWTQEIEMPRNITPSLVREGGASYKVGTYMKYVVFPQQTGKLTIPGITFDCDVIQQDRSIDPLDAFFNGGGSISRKVQRTTEPFAIEVLPLPAKPAGFSGGVGQFSIKPQLITQQPKTNDVATLRLTVSGTGNMKLIKAPAIEFPKDFDSYEAKMTDKTRVSADGISGEVYFDYTFVPRNVGKYEIPAADFIYFDTQRREYVTLHTAPIALDVKKGQRSKEDVEAELAMRNADVHDIHIGQAAIVRHGFNGSSSWIGSWRYFGVLALIVLASLALMQYVRRRAALNADVAGTRNRKARKKANKHLREAEKAMAGADHNAFYSALSQALRGYFADKLTRDAAALTNDTILTALAERGLDEESIGRTRTLLEDCDFARFAPSPDASQREKDLERASELFALLDTKL